MASFFIAKKLVVFVDSRKALAMAVNNGKLLVRQTVGGTTRYHFVRSTEMEHSHRTTLATRFCLCYAVAYLKGEYMTAKVNEKSTKTDIWEAYKQLLSELQQRPVSMADDPAKLQKMGEALAEAKAALIGRFETTIERLGTIQQSYAEADQDLARRKSTVIGGFERDKQQLESAMESVRRQWEQEKADHELQRQREEDVYQYNLTRKRRDEQELYEQKTKAREATLVTRETELTKREQTMEDLTKQVEAFPAQLEATMKTSKEDTAKALKAEYTIELKDAKQQADHEKSILNLKLQTAEATIAAQVKQIIDLQRQLEVSASQLKEMAVTVIQAKNVSSTPVAQQ